MSVIIHSVVEEVARLRTENAGLKRAAKDRLKTFATERKKLKSQIETLERRLAATEKGQGNARG